MYFEEKHPDPAKAGHCTLGMGFLVVEKSSGMGK